MNAEAAVEMTEEVAEQPAGVTEGGEQPAEDAAQPAEATTLLGKQPEAPEQPEAALTVDDLKAIVPEGFELQAETAEEFVKAIADPELDPKTRAEQLIKLHAEAIEAQFKELAEQHQAQVAEWERQTRAEFGSGLDAALQRAKAVATEYGGDGFLDVLDQSGLGSHPEVIRFLAKVGEQLAEAGGVTAEGEASSADIAPVLKVFGVDKG